MIDVAIMAYNRPDYLKNCVDSVRRNIPQARIRVYDDVSDDPQQLRYLKELGDEAVISPSEDKGRHGNLHANMAAALAGAQHDLLLILQDDMQVVRPVNADDIAQINACFQRFPESGFVSPLFMRGDRMRRFKRELAPMADMRFYISDPANRGDSKKFLSYFDSHIAHVARLRAAKWNFNVPGGEGVNRQNARVVFGAMPMMADPFVFFCPEVPFFRNRQKKTLAARIARRFVGDTVKAYHDLTTDKVSALKSRPLSRWPEAEKFLEPTDKKVVRPFVYKDVKARLWLYALHKIEQKFQK